MGTTPPGGLGTSKKRRPKMSYCWGCAREAMRMGVIPPMCSLGKRVSCPDHQTAEEVIAKLPIHKVGKRFWNRGVGRSLWDNFKDRLTF